MKKIFEYIKSFNPVDFPTTARLILTILSILSMFIFFCIFYFHISKYMIFNIFVSIILSFIFFLTIDLTFGFGRNYSDKGFKNLFIFIPFWIFYFTFTYYVFL